MKWNCTNCFMATPVFSKTNALTAIFIYFFFYTHILNGLHKSVIKHHYLAFVEIVLFINKSNEKVSLRLESCYEILDNSLKFFVISW